MNPVNSYYAESTAFPVLFTADEIDANNDGDNLIESPTTRKPAYNITSYHFKDVQKALKYVNSKFPHVTKNFNDYWGTRQFNDYVMKLTTHDRPNRQGFPFLVLQAIIFLQAEHNKAFPQYEMNE